MAKQTTPGEHYTQSWTVLHQPDALLHNPRAKDGGELDWRRKDRDGRPIRENGFNVPPGSRIDASKLGEKQRERLLAGRKHFSTLAKGMPVNPSSTLVFDEKMRLRSPERGK